jgi:hypothetical protein
MEYLKQLFKRENMPQTILIVLFILFLSMSQPLPIELARLIDTPVGSIVVIIVALSLFMYANPVLAIIGLFVAFEIIRRSGANSLNYYMPSESKKWEATEETNKVQYTLEQEIVKNMAPLTKPDISQSSYSFSPIGDYTHDAAGL